MEFFAAVEAPHVPKILITNRCDKRMHFGDDSSIDLRIQIAKIS